MVLPRLAEASGYTPCDARKRRLRIDSVNVCGTVLHRACAQESRNMWKFATFSVGKMSANGRSIGKYLKSFEIQLQVTRIVQLARCARLCYTHAEFRCFENLNACQLPRGGAIRRTATGARKSEGWTCPNQLRSPPASPSAMPPPFSRLRKRASLCPSLNPTSTICVPHWPRVRNCAT